jgi:hypothetical protein
VIGGRTLAARSSSGVASGGRVVAGVGVGAAVLMRALSGWSWLVLAIAWAAAVAAALVLRGTALLVPRRVGDRQPPGLAALVGLAVLVVQSSLWPRWRCCCSLVSVSAGWCWSSRWPG